MGLHKYDELLHFDLQEDFHVIRGANDEGEPTFGIGMGKTTTDDGTESYECRLNLQSQDRENFDLEGLRSGSALKLAGNPENALLFSRNTTSVLGREIGITTAVIFLVHDTRVYLINSVVVGGQDRLDKWLGFLNRVLGAMVLDGQKSHLEELTAQMVEKRIAAAEAEAEAALPYPAATPQKGQHTHLDFLQTTRSSLGMLGGLVQMNQTGTEYSFEAIDPDFLERFENRNTLTSLYTADKAGFPLAKTALQMGQIFRLSKDMFDPSEDREQEIENGLVRRCSMYEAFRSFAWTLAAYCNKENLTPEKLDIDLLEEIAEFVTAVRDNLNYTAGSYCPTLCSGDDIHNYYIPDGASAAAKAALLKCLEQELAEDADYDPKAHILSLDGLRKDLTYLFPAMQTIYDALAETRDPEEPLEGPVAEVLYVWCAMTYAARTPIYTDDGPMNCFWAHPGKEAVLKPFGKGSAPKPAQDHGYRICYDQGIKFQNEHYTFYIPDGFRLLKNAEDRDFIAYLPSKEDPDDYLESDFIIYAGQDQDGSVNSNMRLPMLYCAVYNSFVLQVPGAKPHFYERRDLPGILVSTADRGCVHANAFLAYGETIKMMRFQIAVSGKKQADACIDLLLRLLDRMIPKTPVTMLAEIDDPKYVAMDLSSPAVEEWISLLKEYAGQMIAARNAQQSQLVDHFRSNNPGMPRIRKALKEMLRYHTDHAERYLQKADGIYQLKRAQFPDHKALPRMKQAIDETLLELTDQFVNLGEEKIRITTDYPALYRQHCRQDVQQVISRILSTCTDGLSDAAVKALKSAQLSPEEIAKLAAQRIEAERLRKEKEAAAEAERRRKEEEERQRAEQKRREEQEKREREEALRQEEEARQAAERHKQEEEARIAAEKAAAQRRAEEEAAARERAEHRRQKREAFLKKLKKALILFLVVSLLLGTIAVLTVTVILPAAERAKTYKAAQAHLEAGQYQEAEAGFRALGNYKDAADMVFATQYREAESLLAAKQYPQAITLWQSLGSYQDSAQRALLAEEQWRDPDYRAATDLMEQGEYLSAAELFATLENYRDSKEKVDQCHSLHLEQQYNQATEIMEASDYPRAMALFQELGGYRDSAELYLFCAYTYGQQLLEEEKYSEALKYWQIASGYQDADQQKVETHYRYGNQLLKEEKFSEAITQFGLCKDHPESPAMLQKAKYEYVKAHLDRSDANTRSYITELVADNYSGAQKLYDQLYAWKVEIIAFNNSPYDQTNQKSISKYQGMYCHFKVTGGEPGQTINLKAHITAPNGQSGTVYFNSCSDGSTWSTCFSYDMPYYGATGTMSVRIMNADTGKQMDSGSVSVTN